MKREIVCADQNKTCVHGGADRLVYGVAAHDYRCDWCNRVLQKGTVVCAVTTFRDNAEKAQDQNWEHDYIRRVGDTNAAT